jgi:hypothetical protein
VSKQPIKASRDRLLHLIRSRLRSDFALGEHSVRKILNKSSHLKLFYRAVALSDFAFSTGSPFVLRLRHISTLSNGVWSMPGRYLTGGPPRLFPVFARQQSCTLPIHLSIFWRTHLILLYSLIHTCMRTYVWAPKTKYISSVLNSCWIVFVTNRISPA